MKQRLCFLLSMVLIALCGCAPQTAPPQTPRPSIAAPTPAATSYETAAEPLPAAPDTVILLHIREAAPSQNSLDMILPAVNGLLTALDKPNIGLKVIDTKDYMVTTRAGSDIDAFCISSDVNFESFATTGLIADITDALPRHEAFYHTIPADALIQCTLEGRIYAVPLVQRMDYNGTYETGVMIRTDILKALDASLPESPEALLTLCQEAKSAGLDYELAYYLAAPPYAFHRTYDEWPFFVDNSSIASIGLDGGVTAYVDTDIFRRDAALMSLFKEAGLLRPVAAVEQLDALERQWDVLAALYPLPFPKNDGAHAADVTLVQFAPERETFRITPYSSNLLAVSAHAKDIDNTLEAIGALLTEQEVYDTFMYGIEGTDWQEAGDGTMRSVTQDRLNAAMFGYYYRDRLIEDYPARMRAQTALAQNTQLVDFKAPLHSFNLAAEHNKVFGNAFMTEILLYRAGDSGINADKTIEMMRENGMDGIIEEYMESYNRFLAEYQ